MSSIYKTKKWAYTRRMAIERSYGRCEARDAITNARCSTDISAPGKARVDHIKPVKAGGAPYDLGNVRVLCAEHDNQAHREKSKGGSGPREQRFIIKGCDEKGVPLSRKQD